jgi:hypothetical protein
MKNRTDADSSKHDILEQSQKKTQVWNMIRQSSSPTPKLGVYSCHTRTPSRKRDETASKPKRQGSKTELTKRHDGFP